MTRFNPWLRAARPVAHPMIALPLFLGQLHAARQLGPFSWLQFALLAAFGMLLQAFVLYLNDYADEETDRLNENFFLSGGSRVIPTGQLTGKQLLRGAWLVLGVLLVLGVAHSTVFGRSDIWLGYILAVLLGWAYSMPPLSASYRGWGELLQAVSCGVLLPALGNYGQCGTLEHMPWSSVLPIALLFYASNITTALPDYDADRRCQRHTYPVRRSEATARRDVLLVLCAAIATSLVTALDRSHMILLGVVNLPVLWILWKVYRGSAFSLGNADSPAHCHAFVAAMSKAQAALLVGWVAVLAAANGWGG